MLSAIPAAMADGHPLMMLGMGPLLSGLGFKIAAFPSTCGHLDTYEAASTPFVAWLSVAPKAAGFVAIIRLYIEGVGSAAFVGCPPSQCLRAAERLGVGHEVLVVDGGLDRADAVRERQ